MVRTILIAIRMEGWTIANIQRRQNNRHNSGMAECTLLRKYNHELVYGQKNTELLFQGHHNGKFEYSYLFFEKAKNDLNSGHI